MLTGIFRNQYQEFVFSTMDRDYSADCWTAI